jgi:hypothetical protein
VVCGKLIPTRLYPLPVLVKDRWIRPREQVLNIPITCWYMSLLSLVVSCQQKLNFSPLCHWLLWERSWVRTYGSISRRTVDCVESPSSRGQWICSNLLMTMRKVAMCWPREICIVWDYTRTERGMRMACWSGFPCRVYINSNHRDSRIWVTACSWQSSRSESMA